MAPYDGGDQWEKLIDSELNGNNEDDDNDGFIVDDQIIIVNTDSISVMHLFGQIVGASQLLDVEMGRPTAPMYYPIMIPRAVQFYVIQNTNRIFGFGFYRLDFEEATIGSDNAEISDELGSGGDSLESLMSHVMVDRISSPTNEDVRSAWVIQNAWRRFRKRGGLRIGYPKLVQVVREDLLL